MTNTGILINVDLNASYQIIRKVFPNAFAEGIEGVGLHPIRVNVA
jgi:putative transposase